MNRSQVFHASLPSCPAPLFRMPSDAKTETGIVERDGWLLLERGGGLFRRNLGIHFFREQSHEDRIEDPLRMFQ